MKLGATKIKIVKKKIKDRCEKNRGCQEKLKIDITKTRLFRKKLKIR